MTYKVILTLLSVTALLSCQSVRTITVDYMVPARVSLPAHVRRIALINNTGGSDPKETIPAAIETLAQTIARQNYFDEVIICDSVLRAADIHPRESLLSATEVLELTENLEADALVAFENLHVETLRTIEYLPDVSIYYGLVHAQIQPLVRIYLPLRNTPPITLSDTDSIYWQKFDPDRFTAMHVISEDQLLKEASEVAGTLPAKHLVPLWKTVDRYIYTNGSVEMRDAALYAQKNNWEKARQLWLQTNTRAKKGKQQMQSALNIAVAYEMTDNPESALAWAQKAREKAQALGRSQETLYISLYIQELNQRCSDLPKLNEQMQRFAD